MVNYIKIGGKERPIAFGYDVGIEYELHTGKNYNALIFQIIEQTGAASERFADNDLGGVAASMSLLPISTVVYYGLRFGCREERIDVDFELADVAKWIFGDAKAMEICITLLFDSLPRPGEDDSEPAKKKMVRSRPGSSGKALSRQRQK